MVRPTLRVCYFIGEGTCPEDSQCTHGCWIGWEVSFFTHRAVALDQHGCSACANITGEIIICWQVLNSSWRCFIFSFRTCRTLLEMTVFACIACYLSFPNIFLLGSIVYNLTSCFLRAWNVLPAVCEEHWVRGRVSDNKMLRIILVHKKVK